jgi:hypothetical protein
MLSQSLRSEIKMSVKIDISKAEKRIDKFLGEVEKLLKLSYSEGEEKKYDLDAEVKNFVRVAFTDYKEKIKSYIGLIVEITGVEKTSAEKQRDYESSLKRRRRHLVAWKEELRLKKEVEEERSDLDKLRSKITKADLETKRREKVAKSKFYGAVIELLDIQRDTIKDKEQGTKAIIEMQKDIADIKELLTKK